MSWQELILLGTIANALGAVSIRVLARDKQTAGAGFAMAAGYYVAIFVSRLLFLPLLGHVHTQVLGEYWWRFVGGGLAFALTNFFTYKTLVYFEVAVANIVGSVNVIFAVVGSAVFLGENLSSQQFVGAAVLLPAIAYGVLATHVVRKKSAQRSIKLGLSFALLAGVTFAVAMVNEKSLLGHMSVASYVVFGVAGQLVMAMLSAVLLQRPQLHLLLRSRVAGWNLLIGVLLGIGGLCFILTEVKSNNLALAAVISSCRLIVVVLLGAWLLKERQRLRQKLTAAAVAIVGLGLIFWK